MKFGRFIHEGRAVYGMVEEGMVYVKEGSIFEEPRKGEAIGLYKDLEVSLPCEPTKVVGIARNYRSTGKNDPAPQFFFASRNTWIASGESIVLPWMSESVGHEPELAVVMGKQAKNVPVDRALDYVLGYTCANDVTERHFFRKDRVGAGRSKSFDTFCPLGPVIAAGIDGNDLAICARVNDKLEVSSRTSQMVFKVEEVVSFLSCVMTLFPGDVIMMSAPGITALNPGDVVEIEIEGIGILRNPVEATTYKPVRWRKE